MVIAKKSCKYDEYRSFEHLLCLFDINYFYKHNLPLPWDDLYTKFDVVDIGLLSQCQFHSQ